VLDFQSRYFIQDGKYVRIGLSYL
jgi:PX domain